MEFYSVRTAFHSSGEVQFDPQIKSLLLIELVLVSLRIGWQDVYSSPCCCFFFFFFLQRTHGGKGMRVGTALPQAHLSPFLCSHLCDREVLMSLVCSSVKFYTATQV